MPSRRTPRCASGCGRPVVEPAPARAGVLRAPDGRVALGHAAPVAGVERDDVEAVAVVRMRGGREAELGRQAVGDLRPRCGPRRRCGACRRGSAGRGDRGRPATSRACARSSRPRGSRAASRRAGRGCAASTSRRRRSSRRCRSPGPRPRSATGRRGAAAAPAARDGRAAGWRGRSRRRGPGWPSSVLSSDQVCAPSRLSKTPQPSPPASRRPCAAVRPEIFESFSSLSSP